MSNGRLMKIKSIAEFPFGAICITFDLHLAIIGFKTDFCFLFFSSGHLRQVLLYVY